MANKLEIYGYLDCSTVHISDKDMSLLTQNIDSIDGFIVYPKGDNGFFVYVFPDDDADVRSNLKERGYSEAILHIVDLARSKKAQWIMFDPDGAEYSFLPEFNE